MSGWKHIRQTLLPFVDVWKVLYKQIGRQWCDV